MTSSTAATSNAAAPADAEDPLPSPDLGQELRRPRPGNQTYRATCHHLWTSSPGLPSRRPPGVEAGQWVAKQGLKGTGVKWSALNPERSNLQRKSVTRFYLSATVGWRISGQAQRREIVAPSLKPFEQSGPTKSPGPGFLEWARKGPDEPRPFAQVRPARTHKLPVVRGKHRPECMICVGRCAIRSLSAIVIGREIK